MLFNMRRAVYTFTALLSSKNDKKRSNRLPEKSCHFESVGRCRFLPAMKSPLCYSHTAAGRMRHRRRIAGSGRAGPRF